VESYREIKKGDFMKLSLLGMFLGVFLLVFTVGLFSLDVKAEEERWKLVYKDDEDTWYIDNKSISYPSENIVRVRLKWVPESKPKLGEDYEYSLGLEERNCLENKIRLLELGNYNKDGNILNSFDASKLEWRPIIPGSVGETLHKVICEHSKGRQK